MSGTPNILNVLLEAALHNSLTSFCSALLTELVPFYQKVHATASGYFYVPIHW
jgi:hypothetical protein